MYSGGPKHPIFSGSTFGLMSGEKPLYPSQAQGGHEALGQALHSMGLRFDETHGKYKEPERSYIVYNPTEKQMQHLGKLFGQESVVHSSNGQHKLIYTNGPNEGKHHKADASNPMEHHEMPPDDFYTAVPYHGYARINFDFNQLHDNDQVKVQKSYEPAEAAELAKHALGALLQSQKKAPHPHAYDWHDGHTDHHQEDLAQPSVPGLAKADGVPHPHMDAPPKMPNEQAAGVGVSTYRQFALPFGNVTPGANSDLLHYKYQGKLPDIEKLVHDHGYKTYYAGGKYGKPDLANKNYNTGHLMVYDPSPASGGDFGQEEYTRGWRQIHELAHAITLPAVNKIYGEGRRMGKLGTHRTMNEALRAVHWEWLAAHKQRELSEQVGVHVPDETFHKELNTVMHDAAHRAVSGKFTEPSGEGFQPHSHKVPLSTALQMVHDSAHKMGLTGMHQTLGKAEPGDSNSPGMQTSAPKDFHGVVGSGTYSKPVGKAEAPAAGLHNSVEGFMAGLKSLPKGHPSRGQFITSHMNHSPFLQALRAHPQGPQIHQMLTQHLNSRVNAGFKPGSTSVTVKSEPRTAIYEGAEGETPVAEKLYTPEEVREILMKATREKIEVFERELQGLRERELKKAVIPSHIHNEGVSAGAGVEDIPAGKMGKAAQPLSKPPVSQAQRAAMGAAAGGHSTLGIPKGVGKEFIDADKGGKLPHKVAKGVTGSGDVAATAGGSMGSGVVAGPSSTPMAMSELCKECGESHLGKCGEIAVGKTELVDAKGQHKESGVHPQSQRPDDKKSKEINKDTKKGGSGGIVLPGKKPKKAGPVTKQKVNDTKNDTGKVSDLVLNKSDKTHVCKHGLCTKGIKGDKEYCPAHMPKEVKKAQPPMAKPPSGQNMGTSVPTSAPKPPMAKAGAMPGMAGKPPDMQAHASHAASLAAPGAGAPAAAPKPMPSPGQHAERAQAHQAALGGAFQPKGPVSSGLELASKPGGVKLPGAHLKPAGGGLGLKPPPAAAKPSKPGIFGKMQKI